MMEQPPKEEGNKKEHSVHFTRHSKAGYKTYVEISKSNNPQQAVNPEEQITPDLLEKGIEMAQKAAEKFFDGLNPETDFLFFGSSNEARALETADIYRQVALERGFNVIRPEHVRGKLAEEIGGGDIRVIENLSLNIDNNLIGMVFNPKSNVGEINWDAVDEETKKRWVQARAIIDADDKGSWGANSFYHSAEIKKIFPEIESAEDKYNRKFKNLTRLARFGIEKAKESGIKGNVKILAFGHEDYIGYALDKYFSDHEIANCETISIKTGEDNSLTIERRGEKKKINN